MRRRGPRMRSVIAALAALLAGCSASDPGSATRGLSLEMWMQGGENRAAFYRLETDGTLGFGGGADALSHNITWTGPLTAGEIERLWVLLDEHGWLTGGLAELQPV